MMVSLRCQNWLREVFSIVCVNVAYFWPLTFCSVPCPVTFFCICICSNMMAQLTMPWDQTKNLATKFVRDNRVVKVGIDPQPNLHLALAIKFAKSSGKYDAKIYEFEAWPAANKTFTNFQPFLISEFATCNKPAKSTTKSVGFGTANAMAKPKLWKMPLMPPGHFWRWKMQYRRGRISKWTKW